MTCMSIKTHAVMHTLARKILRRTFAHQCMFGWLIYSICYPVCSLFASKRCLFTLNSWAKEWRVRRAYRRIPRHCGLATRRVMCCDVLKGRRLVES